MSAIQNLQQARHDASDPYVQHLRAIEAEQAQAMKLTRWWYQSTLEMVDFTVSLRESLKSMQT